MLVYGYLANPNSPPSLKGATMAQHVTHKGTSHGKASTLATRTARAAKYGAAQVTRSGRAKSTATSNK